ncbi:hypothetical protein BMETH_508_0 [methanotrophic bacterial endosymbiont of Bathymodiolus sp.]|nr:hypothetical protein BMETH_508_0 [methanotrophic bacterial endosymbiont of Bathymodiolus sp.]
MPTFDAYWGNVHLANQEILDLYAQLLQLLLARDLSIFGE